MTKGATASDAGIIGLPVFEVIGNDSWCQGPNNDGLRAWDEDDGIENVGVDESVEIDESVEDDQR